MYQNSHILLGAFNWPYWLAQLLRDPRVNTPEDAALLYSGPQFFIALISGVVLAFAFQLLLTNLSVAAGLSYWGSQERHDDRLDPHHGDRGSSPVQHIGRKVGTWTLITVTIALFFACLLAVKLSLIGSTGLGAIVGLVIWGTYFSLLAWVSSAKVGSLIGSVVNAATSGFQAILGTATAALGAKAASDQVVATAQAAARAVGRELGAAIDPTSIRETVEDYIQKIKPPELDVQAMRREFEKLLNDPQLRELAPSGGLPNIDRDTLAKLVSDRTDLSKQDVNRIVDQLQEAWRQVGHQVQQPDRIGQAIDYLKSAKPGESIADRLAQQLEPLIAELRQQRQGQTPENPTPKSG